MPLNTHSIDLEHDSTQYLSVADTASLSITGDISVEAWVKPESLVPAGEAYTIVSKLNTGQLSYFFSFTPTEKLDADLYDSVGAETYKYTTNTVYDSGSVGTWIHVAVTVDISVPTVVFYVNGVETAQTNVVANAHDIKDSTAAFEIGNNELNNNTANNFDGLIDEVRVWNDIRTAQEISDNMSIHLVGNEANLVGYWRLNNNLLDQTANDNDLTNNNSAAFSTDVPFAGTADEGAARGFMTTNKYW